MRIVVSLVLAHRILGRRVGIAACDDAQKAEMPRKAGHFDQAAEETRTLDLLHGKQTL
jgi:hypothetical protein